MSREPQPPLDVDSPGSTILIIDDDVSNLAIVTEYLKERDREILVAEDGQTGLERAGFARPDLILLDVLMPGLDGFEICRRLKGDEATRDIPVIFMTALADMENKIKGFRAGAVDYVTKPCQREEVLARVGVHLKIRALTRSLRDANESLEKRVEERTLDLARANEELQQEIAERKQAEAALKESEAKYRTIFENSGTALIFIEEDMTISLANKEFEKLSGYSSSEIEGKKGWVEFVENVDDAERMKEYHRMRRIDPRSAPKTYEFRLRNRFSCIKDVVMTVTLMPGRKQSLGAILDITERKHAEVALAKARNFLDEIINSISDPVFVKDRKHRWILVNDAFCRFMGHGLSELLGKSDYDFVPQKEADIFWSKDEDVLLTGAENINEEEFTDARGSVHTIVTKKTLYTDEEGEKYIVGIIRDITERKRLEQQLRQAVKMEAVGTLAGGVAHDFNNHMMAVIGYSELILQRIEAGSALQRDVQQIRKAGERAASLTKQLLSFSRRQVVQPKVLDLNAVMADMEKMLRRLIGEDIDLVSIPCPELGRVLADPDLIGQVIMNLAINARDAMPDGGKLTIETANVCLDEAYTRQHHGVEPGSFVLLALSDTGAGMDEATLSRIFEPFFTTKPRGKGTGLGLSVVYGIVKQSGGHIWAYSEPGRGTTFKVYLPRAEEESERVGLRARCEELLGGGTETVLVVEDEKTVRDLTCRILREHGYTVLEACNGQEGIGICIGRNGPIHLLITDVVMPGMSGRELARKIEKLRPATKVLYISGYTDKAIVHHGVLDAGTCFLQKPFTAAHLARKVREILNSLCAAESPEGA